MQPRNSKPYITGGLIALNVLAFFFLEALGDTENSRFMIEHGALYLPLVLGESEYYRCFTSVFMHFGIRHLMNNMLVLFVLGEHLERALGRIKYLVFYLLCGIGANVVSMLYDIYTAQPFTISAGASGAVFGVVGGLFYAVAVNRGRLEELSVRQLAVMILISFYHGMTSTGINNAAHAGGFVCGIFLGILLYRRPRNNTRKNCEYFIFEEESEKDGR